MYSRKAWGGAVDPFILVKFLKPSPKDGSDPPDTTVSLVLFEWQDKNLIGKVPNPERPEEVPISLPLKIHQLLMRES